MSRGESIGAGVGSLVRVRVALVKVDVGLIQIGPMEEMYVVSAHSGAFKRTAVGSDQMSVLVSMMERLSLEGLGIDLG
jgi:hypothetical protein